METKEKEVWRKIPGFEYYQASSLGRIKSLDRWVTYIDGRERFFKGRILKGSISKGYRQVMLCVNGEETTLKVSQIIAMTYLEHIPNGHTLVVDHINGIRSDDRLSNLRIVTHRENTSDNCFRKDRSSLSSKFTGVTWHKPNSKWLAKIVFKGKNTHLGLFNDELEASEAYQNALAKVKDGTFSASDYKPKWSSRYKGVYFSKADNKWMSYIYIERKKKHLGSFNTEIEAYEALQKFKQEVKKH